MKLIGYFQQVESVNNFDGSTTLTLRIALDRHEISTIGPEDIGLCMLITAIPYKPNEPDIVDGQVLGIDGIRRLE